jgi:hypothetical protein
MNRKEIQERHDEHEKILAEMRIAYADKNRKPIELLTNKAHIDRGYLLERLAAVEAASNTVQCPDHEVCPRTCFHRLIKDALK